MKQILAIDDNKMNLTAVKNALSGNYKVAAVTMGEQALLFLQKKKCDLILLDIEMPQMDGFEVIKQIKEQRIAEETPIVFLTADSDKSTRKRCLEAGAVDVLVKPVPSNVLLEKTAYYLERGTGVDTMRDVSEEILPPVEGIRWDLALELMRNSEMVLTTVKDFMHLSKKHEKELRGYYQMVLQNANEENMKKYRVLVHSMKTSAAMIGAVALSEIAKRLERAAKEEDASVVEVLTPFFLEDWSRLTVDLENAIAADDEKVEIDYFMVKEYAILLTKAANDADIDAMDAIADGLSMYEYPEEQKQVVDDIIEAVQNVDYDACIDLAITLQKIIKGENV